MPRLARLDIAGVPQHVMQIGAGDTPTFACADDKRQAFPRPFPPYAETARRQAHVPD